MKIAFAKIAHMLLTDIEEAHGSKIPKFKKKYSDFLK